MMCVQSDGGGNVHVSAEQDVLNDWKFVEHLDRVHLDKAGVDLGPGGDAAYVPQLIGVLGKRTVVYLVVSSVCALNDDLLYVIISVKSSALSDLHL